MTSELASELRPLLCGTFGAPLRHLDEVDSTNSEALRWATTATPAPEGAVVIADFQTAGRGRWGREWLGAPGGSLMVSVVLRPKLPADRLDLLTTTVGVATVEAIRETTGADALLKWPNDVVVDGRKLAGILVESHSSKGAVEVAIAGIGVNLDLSGAPLPDDIARRAVSVAELTPGSAPSRAQVLAAILSWLEPLYASLATDTGAEEVVRLATEHSAILGREVELRFADDTTRTGTARRVLADGSLEVEFPEGLEAVRAGEITRTKW